MSEIPGPDDLVVQFLQAAYQDEIDEFLFQEGEIFLAQLLQLPPEDIRKTIQTLVGYSCDDTNFYARIREKGWVFKPDTDTNDPPGKYGQDDHGSYRIGSKVTCPGSLGDFRIEDVARIVRHEEAIQKLF